MSGISGLASRYQVTGTLGQGGMGIVYRAHDQLMNRAVAIKTIRDSPEPQMLEMFQKEWRVLASLNHPNVVEIYDVAELKDGDAVKPYFVMPLLTGATLADLIRNALEPIHLDRITDIIGQTCRGLQAAHSKGLVHRDLKPNNIFVMEDDSVKIIDFGVARLGGANTNTRVVGTSSYMAPEQIRGEPCTAQSDLFSLGVVCYEALSGVRPFIGSSPEEVEHFVLTGTPKSVIELRPDIPPTLSRVVHKALAKRASFRFADARQFAEAIQKAARNESITIFDLSHARPRIERAMEAFKRDSIQMAAEILEELESDGHTCEEMTRLRSQINQRLRDNSVKQLLTHARQAFELDEFSVALRKIDEALTVVPDFAPALNLRAEVEGARISHEVRVWLRLARSHLERYCFEEAYDAVQQASRLHTDSGDAVKLKLEIQQKEADCERENHEAQALYQAAQESLKTGEILLALQKAQVLVELDRSSSYLLGRVALAEHQRFHDRVLREHNEHQAAIQEILKRGESQDFVGASLTCHAELKKYPNNDRLKFIETALKEQHNGFIIHSISGVHDRLLEEVDFARKIQILESAIERFPGVEILRQSLDLVKTRQTIVKTLVSKAADAERQLDYGSSMHYLETLEELCPSYPGLQLELDRTRRLIREKMPILSSEDAANRSSAASNSKDIREAVRSGTERKDQVVAENKERLDLASGHSGQEKQPVIPETMRESDKRLPSGSDAGLTLETDWDRNQKSNRPSTNANSDKASNLNWLGRHRRILIRVSGVVVAAAFTAVSIAIFEGGNQQLSHAPTLVTKQTEPIPLPVTGGKNPPDPAAPVVESKQKEKALGKVKVKDLSPGHANVHSGASQSSSSIGTVAKGKVYDYIKVSFGWYLLVDDRAEIGWVAERYLERVR